MTKTAYERPVLIRHEAGLLNKFPRLQSMRPLAAVEGVAIAELVERYGSPLYVFSQRAIEQSYDELRAAFSRRFARLRLAWSYKTNYLGAIARIFHDRGAYAEVVSDFEYEKARALGVPGERIHFNGPYKPAAALEAAASGGALIHLDHFEELAALEAIARDRGLRPKAALRLNFALEGTPRWGRFGFDVDSGQALEAAGRLLSGGALELAGIHCHVGTFITDVDVYRRSAAAMAGFANALRRRHGVELEFIDLGGGFASRNTLKGQLLPGEQATPPFERYAEAIADGLAELERGAGPGPTLVLETGRALIDDGGFLVATVVANKRLPDGRRALVIDAGVNLLFTSFWYHHEVRPAAPVSGLPEPTVIVGPLCMNIDVVRDTLLFPPLGAGDRLVFCRIGAYNLSQWMQFITYRPNVVLVSGGEHALIRRRESLEVVTAQEEMPPWLTRP